MWRRIWAVLLTILAVFLPLRGATAQPASAEGAFFKAKTVRLVVGYGPGGGYDTYARLIAPYIGQALGANVVVENQPGAGGLTALDRVYHADPDGLTIMIVNGTPAVLAQLLEQRGVRYDLAKMGQLGIVTSARHVWIAGPQAPFKSPAEALKLARPIRWAASGVLDGPGDGAEMTCAALKLSCKIILGYRGSNEAMLGVSRGEADSFYQSDTSAQIYTRSGEARVISVINRHRSSLFPNVPTIFEQLPLDKDAQWWLDYRAKAETLGRILVAPPNLAPERLAFLQAAVRKALADSALIAKGERLGFPIEYGDAEDARKAALDVVAKLTPAQRRHIKSVVLAAQ